MYRICELYIDDVLIHGKDPETFLANVRKVFERLREFNVAVEDPKKTKLGLAEVEYVGHVVSATGTSFTEEKRLKVLNFRKTRMDRRGHSGFRVLPTSDLQLPRALLF